jgi:hypothetical protein
MADKPAGRKPDFNLSTLNTETEVRGRVGAGWKERDGSISIKLNPCVVLNAHDPINLRLFPATEYNKPAASPPPIEDDEIPF